MKQSELLLQIRQWLTENFKTGDLIPGEVELSEKFHVSRATIREVIIHLSFLRVLERRSKRGTIMRAPDEKDISDTLSFQLQAGGYGFEEMKQTRLFLETSQAELIIQKATPQDLDRLQTIIDDMERTTDVEKADHLDLAFHLALVSVTGNRILGIFSGIMLLMFDKRYRTPFLNINAIRKSVRDHRKMLDAIHAQDPSLLRTLIRNHIQPL